MPGWRFDELTDGGQTAEQVAARGRGVPARGRAHARAGPLRHPPARRGRGSRRRRAAGRGRARGRGAAALQRRLGPPARDPAAAEHPARAPARAADRRPRRARDPRPDAPQVRGPRRRGGLDRLGELDDRLVDAAGERGRRGRLGAARRPPTSRTSRSCGSGATSSARGRVEPGPRSSSAAACSVRAWFTPGHGDGALTGDRDGDRVRAAAGADRLAGDHLGADPRDARRARRRGAASTSPA